MALAPALDAFFVILGPFHPMLDCFLMPRSCRFRGGVAAVATGALLLAGCDDSPQIRQYTVPKLAVEGKQRPAPQAAAEQSILGAVALTGTTAWFFKVTGDPAAVSAARDEVTAFVKGVQFSADGPPTWQLPEGWKERPGDQFRHATLEMSTTPPLEMSISQLPRGEDDAEYLLQNINRWRGQVNLPPTTSEELAADGERFVVGEFPVTLVELTGTAGGSMGGPFAGGAGGGPFAKGELPDDHPPIRGGSSTAGRDDAASPITYTVPEGWQEQAAGGLRAASFVVVEGDQKLDISVIPLSPEGPAADVTENVNRWRGQVGLARQSAEEVAGSLREIEGQGIDWQVVVLEGESPTAGPQMLLGAIGKTPAAAWFVKLSGPPRLARREKAHFDEFVGSLKVKN